jgi:hypothetical protein
MGGSDVDELPGTVCHVAFGDTLKQMKIVATTLAGFRGRHGFEHSMFA